MEHYILYITLYVNDTRLDWNLSLFTINILPSLFFFSKLIAMHSGIAFSTNANTAFTSWNSLHIYRALKAVILGSTLGFGTKQWCTTQRKNKSDHVTPTYAVQNLRLVWFSAVKLLIYTCMCLYVYIYIYIYIYTHLINIHSIHMLCKQKLVFWMRLIIWQHSFLFWKKTIALIWSKTEILSVNIVTVSNLL